MRLYRCGHLDDAGRELGEVGEGVAPQRLGEVTELHLGAQPAGESAGLAESAGILEASQSVLHATQTGEHRTRGVAPHDQEVGDGQPVGVVPVSPSKSLQRAGRSQQAIGVEHAAATQRGRQQVDGEDRPLGHTPDDDERVALVANHGLPHHATHRLTTAAHHHQDVVRLTVQCLDVDPAQLQVQSVGLLPQLHGSAIAHHAQVVANRLDRCHHRTR